MSSYKLIGLIYTLHNVFIARHPLANQGLPHYIGFTLTLRRTTLDRTPLDEISAHRRALYLTTLTRETNIHAPGGIRTLSPSKRAVADPRRRRRGPRDRLLQKYLLQ
jgi:hypothetical protein